MKKSVFLFLCLVATGCKKYDISVSQHVINRNYLASTHINSPDPCQECPPEGEMLCVEWVVPRELLSKGPTLEIDVIYKNYQTAHFSYPIKERRGYATYYLLNKNFCEKRGFLTYKAELVTEEGEVYRKWVHQLWVNLITLEEIDSCSSASDNNSSVIDHPIQGSVMETP